MAQPTILSDDVRQPDSQKRKNPRRAGTRLAAPNAFGEAV